MIVVYGTVCLDVTYQVPKLPEKGRFVDVLQETTALGGEATNTAAALLSWGSDVALVGNSLGNDATASLLSDLLAERGLGHAILPQGEHPAPVCHILVTPDGERTMFGKGFKEMEDHGSPGLVPLQEGAWFTADPNHGTRAREALARAAAAGMKTYALDFVQPEDSLPRGSFWQSSTSWVGKSGDRAGNQKWLEAWVKKHGCTGVLTDGAHDILHAEPDKETVALPVFPIEGVVDATGCGDVFRAGMLHGLSKGWKLGECLAYASAAAALNARAPGAIGGLTDEETVLKLVQSEPELAAHYGRSV